jgi:TolA-binding protein
MRVLRTCGVLLAAAGLAWIAVPHGQASARDKKATVKEGSRNIQTTLSELEGDAVSVTAQTLSRDGYRSQKSPEQRLNDGRVLVQLKSYVPASLVLMDVVENHPQHPAVPEALYLLGEALYGAGDYLGARTRFRELLARSEAAAARPYTSRALGRLIEIAIRTGNFDGVDEYFERLNRLPSQEVEAAATYFRAKFIYNKAVANVEVRKREGAVDAKAADAALLQEARQGFEAVAESSPYYGPARYFVGVILALGAQYNQAIEAFYRVVRLPVNTDEQREIHELAHLALGRVYYETDQLDQAVAAYESIPRDSRHFDSALYEIAWVHIRAKNTKGAEQALATLVETNPDSSHVADGIVLRGNLLLRNGDLDQATDVFVNASAGYGPVRDSLNSVVTQHEDSGAYFKGLVRDHLDDFSIATVLPQAAVPFARDEYELERATEVMAEMAALRALVTETETIIKRFNDALAAENRANIYPDSRRLRLRTTGILNRAALLRMRMIGQVEGKSPQVSGEVAGVRAERKGLEADIKKLPTTEADFVQRDKQPLGKYRTLGHQLRGIEAEVYALEARIAAAERFLRESAAMRSDPTGIAAVENELKGHRRAVELYREALTDASYVIEAGRIRVGVDDERYMAERALRNRYRELVGRELGLLRGVSSAPAEIDPLHTRLGAVESKIDGHDTYIDGVLAERQTELARLIAVEQAGLDGHRQQLASLEGEAEETVGGATLIGFDNVRQRLYDLVLRADVGGVDVRWAEREKHRLNVERLTRDRARELDALDNEYNEIMGTGQGDEQ